MGSFLIKLFHFICTLQEFPNVKCVKKHTKLIIFLNVSLLSRHIVFFSPSITMPSTVCARLFTALGDGE